MLRLSPSPAGLRIRGGAGRRTLVGPKSRVSTDHRAMERPAARACSWAPLTTPSRLDGSSTATGR